MGLVESTNEVVIARMREGAELSDIVYVSTTSPGDPAPLPVPYVMIFCDNGQRTSDLMVQASDKAYFNYTVHLVGETFQQLNRLADQVMDQWLNWRPEIPGAKAFKMVHNFSTPDNTDNSVKPPLLYRVDEWGLRLQKGRLPNG